ncbi:MAG: hypothetical protein ACI85I_002043, partial [Arenicella sp.]
MKLSTWLSLLLYVLAGIGLYAYLLYGETNEFPNWETDKSLILTVGGTSLLAGILMRGLSTWFHVLLPWRKYFGF